MKNHPFSLRTAAAILVISGSFVLTNCTNPEGHATEFDRFPEIFPEYNHLTIPPNIAPLNFVVKEPGTRFRVEISSGTGKPVRIQRRRPIVKIPVKKWKRMLTENAGGTITIDIWSRQDGRWIRYKSIEHRISTDPIDPFLAYRLVHAAYLKWHDMGLYQRNLTNFDERPIIENISTGKGCMNCHSFSNNDPSKMLIHFRILHPGTLLWNEGKLTKIDTRTPNTLSAGIYPSWHPGGKHIAFSTGQISPHLTTRLNKVVDVADRASDLMLYDIENNRVTTSPQISTKRRENMPVWSADGEHLYFLSAPEAMQGDNESLLHSRYDLMCIPYNARRNTWGEAEMVLNSDSTGMSISMPSISPDGRYMVCAMSDFGYFTIFHRDSDLYVVDLQTKAYSKLSVNSESSESFSAWSSNGRWLVFSSKRMDDVFTRPFIAYFDTNGKAHTPFVLPQRDPEVYDRLLANYNIPKLITGKIELNPIAIRDKVLEDPVKVDY